MLKKVLLTAAITGLIAGVAVPIQTSPAQAEMTCREAAKLKHPDDFGARSAYMQECIAAWKASQAPEEKAEEPTYAGDL